MTPLEFREWMRARGLSLSGAASALGYTRTHIANFRAGRTKIGPRQEAVIEAVAQRLGRARPRPARRPNGPAPG